MHILMATSEVVPFAKTGGLADVCGALPQELVRLGHQVTLFLPAFRQALHSGRDFVPTDFRLDIPIGGKIVTGRILESSLPGETVKVYLIEQDGYFDRPGLYVEDNVPYKDNCERFVFFCRGVLEAIRLLGLKCDVMHVHDWQTSLIPAYLKIEYNRVNGYGDIASLLTIHNMGYQGDFWHWDMAVIGLDWKYYNWQQMEFWGKVNLLKTGIVFADAINTVSPTYAAEIQTPQFGYGLEGVLQGRRDVLSGILNGIDDHDWNPASDPHLPKQFDADSFLVGKAACKAALQSELGLPVQADVPLVGFVGRLVDQKGLDLIAPLVERWASTENVQWAFLGTGDPKYHSWLMRLKGEFPNRVAARLEFSNPLAHRIEAGCDLFLMPSQYEPCGLNQMYSLRYGAVPLVRATGGLADTITDASPPNVADGSANGFSFVDYTAENLESTLRRALEVYRSHPEAWRQIAVTGMRQDWSWNRSARDYVALYERMVSAKRRK